MTATLLRKELRQHKAALGWVGIVMLAGFGLVVASQSIAGEGGSIFESLRVFIMIYVVLGGLVLSHRLIALEYTAKTQLFLEALPVSRSRMVAVKCALGLTFMLTVVSLALALACLAGRRHEILTPRFVVILAVRALSVTAFAYLFFFLMSFLGRYRFIAYLTAGATIAVIIELTDLQLIHFGPFALLDAQFAYERDSLPWRALGVTWTLNGVMLALSFMMALIREGSVAAMLAERMSHRERLFVAALLVGSLSALSVFGEKIERAPFVLHDAVTRERPGVVAHVAAGAEGGGDANALAEHIADQLSAAREYLGLSRLPAVFITRRRDLDVNRFERGELDAAHGVHVQANFGAPGFRRDAFTAWLLRETLIVHSKGRALLEPKMWVLDGYALYAGTCERAPLLFTEETVLALRALYGAEAGFSPRDLRAWQSYRERVGGEIATGVAWSGLETLARHHGPDRAARFIRSLLGVEVPKDFRALAYERSTPIEHLLQSEAGVTLEQFWSEWQADLTAGRQELAHELARLPKLRGDVTFAPLSPDSRRVRYRVQITPHPSDEARYSLLYNKLPAFDEEVSPQALRREVNTYSVQREGELSEGFMRGDRFYWTFSQEVPALGCAVLSGWKREQIP